LNKNLPVGFILILDKLSIGFILICTNCQLLAQQGAPRKKKSSLVAFCAKAQKNNNNNNNKISVGIISILTNRQSAALRGVKSIRVACALFNG
jgi:hypothetical protein